MTNVLIPTDLSLGSLEAIGPAAQTVPGKLNIFLFHAFDMPDGLVDAMLLSGIKSPGNLVTEELRLKCRRIKAEHRNINNIYFRTMYGTTVAAFKNFAAASSIDLIVIPEGYRFVPVVRESVDPTRMFRRSGISILNKFAPADAATPYPSTRPQPSHMTADSHLAMP